MDAEGVGAEFYQAGAADGSDDGVPRAAQEVLSEVEGSGLRPRQGNTRLVGTILHCKGVGGNGVH